MLFVPCRTLVATLLLQHVASLSAANADASCDDASIDDMILLQQSFLATEEASLAVRDARVDREVNKLVAMLQETTLIQETAGTQQEPEEASAEADAAGEPAEPAVEADAEVVAAADEEVTEAIAEAAGEPADEAVAEVVAAADEAVAEAAAEIAGEPADEAAAVVVAAADEAVAGVVAEAVGEDVASVETDAAQPEGGSTGDWAWETVQAQPVESAQPADDAQSGDAAQLPAEAQYHNGETINSDWRNEYPHVSDPPRSGVERRSACAVGFAVVLLSAVGRQV